LHAGDAEGQPVQSKSAGLRGSSAALAGSGESKFDLAAGLAAAADAREHNVSNGALQQPVRASESFIEGGAFIQFLHIHILFAGDHSSRFAAGRSHGFDFVGDPGCPADWQ
jgi:hypothetical protein